MARKRGEFSESRFPEPEMLPIMNIIFMLILALVSMAALLPLGVVSSEAQKLAKGSSGAQEERKKKPLDLTVFITSDGFNISVRGEVKMGAQDPNDPKAKLALIPMIANSDGSLEYDHAGLRSKLKEFKKLDPQELSITLTADPEIIFDVIINTMDTARFDEDRQVLFPKVSFAAGIVG